MNNSNKTRRWLIIWWNIELERDVPCACTLWNMSVKSQPLVFHCKFACAIIIDNLNHYSKCLYIYRVNQDELPKMQPYLVFACTQFVLSSVYCFKYTCAACMQSLNVMAWKHHPHYLPFVRGRWIPLVIGHYDETLLFFFFFFFGGGGDKLFLSWTNCWKQNRPVAGDLRVMIWDAMTPHDVTEIYT